MAGQAGQGHPGQAVVGTQIRPAELLSAEHSQLIILSSSSLGCVPWQRIDRRPMAHTAAKSARDIADNFASSTTSTTAATKARMASRILKNAAYGVTDADKLRFVAIEEGPCPAD
jgi:hypothetical protein